MEDEELLPLSLLPLFLLCLDFFFFFPLLLFLPPLPPCPGERPGERPVERPEHRFATPLVLPPYLPGDTTCLRGERRSRHDEDTLDCSDIMDRFDRADDGAYWESTGSRERGDMGGEEEELAEC